MTCFFVYMVPWIVVYKVLNTSCSNSTSVCFPNLLLFMLQYFLGWLSRPDGCNWLSVINYQPGDVIFA